MDSRRAKLPDVPVCVCSPSDSAWSFSCAPELWETSATVKEEEFTRAETLALFDYMRKSRSSGFVVSLSGGADSAAVCTLVALMIERATKELGKDELLARLKYMKRTAAPDVRAILGSALAVVSANEARVSKREVEIAAG